MSYAAPPENANAAAPRINQAGGARAIIIDMRCLQDARYGERGIAAHSRNAILLARAVSQSAAGARIIGLADPALDPLPADAAGAADQIIHHPYQPDLPPGTLFLQPSPMIEDQVFISGFLLNPKVLKVALVYDFIPYDDPSRYLADPRKRLDYFTAMAWLKHYDLYLPISADTERRLTELYPRARERSVVTGVPLPSWVEQPRPPGAAKHILTVAGEDARKNPFVLVRAHAASKVLQAQKIPLVIAGNYSEATRLALRQLAVECGGSAALVRIPGKVAYDVLQGYYRDALCVVTASRAEGFSLPVIEAMAAGVPSIVSDIAVHAALVHDARLRFPPDDALMLADILERIRGDAAYRAKIVAAQAAVWPQFGAREVAGRIWDAIDKMPPPPKIALPRRPRVAMLTPLPPAKSGVGIYSAALAGPLGNLVDLTLFSSSPGSSAPPVSGVPFLSSRFDRVVGVIGNSSDHHGTYDLAVRYGSACICHDARLLGLATTRFGLHRAARMASLELGRGVTETELEAWIDDEQLRAADFLGELAIAARPLILHTKHSVREVKRRFQRDAVFLPFAVQLPWRGDSISAATQNRAREKLGLPFGEKLICSFGSIHQIKGVVPALEAMALLRRDNVACRLLWIGEGPARRDFFEAQAARLGVGERVFFNRDYVSAEKFRDYLLAADAGLQLRAARPGNISGALQDCIAAGLPSVANDDLAENLNAPDFVVRVRDHLAPAEIAAALARVLADARPRGFYEEARAAYCETHSMANYALSLCKALELSVWS